MYFEGLTYDGEFDDVWTDIAQGLAVVGHAAVVATLLLC